MAFLEAKFQAVCECTTDTVVLMDPQGALLYMNHGLDGSPGRSGKDATAFEFWPEHGRSELALSIQRVKITQAMDHYLSKFTGIDGSTEYVETRIAPILQDSSIIAFVMVSSNITQLRRLEKENIKHQANIEETNITLKVLLTRIEKERLLFQENLSTNILCNIEPYMNKLENSSLDRDQKKVLDILKQNIKDMASPLVYSAMTMNLRLTPAEMQISNFIRQGYTSKEIAELLNISPATIDKHRKNIRKKLSITNKKQNLRSVLSSLSS